MIERIISSILILPIRLYQIFISPVLRALFGMQCRYEPSCSHYAIGAIREWGPIRGIWMGTKRICSCHPWGGFGDDPVPPNPKRSLPKH